MANRKYLSEFTLNAYTQFGAIVQQADLALLKDDNRFQKRPCHIYMITRAPRLSIDIASMTMDDHTIKGQFLVQKKNNFVPRPFSIQHTFGTKRLTFESDFPHTRLISRDENGELFGDWKVSMAIREWKLDVGDLLDLEVMYVGQSYGVDGARTAPDRLQAHETLQAIYAETVAKSPDQDVWLVLQHFEEQLMHEMNGSYDEFEKTEEEDIDHSSKIYDATFTEQQTINYAEAGMIRYFQPEFNRIYKDSFPNPAHSTYSQCYDLDIHMLAVSICTDCIRSRIWSPTVAPSDKHLAQFDLRTSEQRRGIFDYFGDGWK
ncbi:MAG: hypothetical protein K8U03_26780 [Planctomycetia bacterium]|nr:hypothetical protein [Planctomycetia bacterium]